MVLLLLLLAGPADPTLDIMNQTAANVKAATEARRTFVYQQRVNTSLVRASGQVSRRERRTYDVVPNEKSTEKKLVEFAGEYRDGKQMVPYSEPGFERKDSDIDAHVIKNLNDELTNGKDSRDGIPHSLFPLREQDLHKYKFRLEGDEVLGGRAVHRVSFEPKPKGECESEDCDAVWKGQVWVDAEDLQPAQITTSLAFRIPWAVRTFLGTNLKQTGFSVRYERVAPGVWFPKTYGTEFRLDLLWGYKRTITLSLESSGFRRTAVNSEIQYQPVP